MAVFETLEVQKLLANTFEPQRQFRFILEIDGIDAFTVLSASKPHMSFDEIEIPYINSRRYLSGRGYWNDITLTLNSPISPSATQKVMEWIYLNYESLTGRAGYASFYKKDFNIKMLGPVGDVVENWVIKGAWVKDADFGPLDYNTDEASQITLTIRYDNAWIEY